MYVHQATKTTSKKNPDSFEHIGSYQNRFERKTNRSSDKNEQRLKNESIRNEWLANRMERAAYKVISNGGVKYV